MMDGRYDPHFAALFAGAPDASEPPQAMRPLWPLGLAAALALALFAALAGLR